MSRLARFAWLTLGYNVAVILWGAYVRATGSGAGCGAHWPLCNGEVIPRAPSAEMLVEYSHRLTSGLALLAVVALFSWTRKVAPLGHPARRGAALTLVFMLTEAAVGAGLVLFQLVADNASVARALFMATHLVNTFFLLASLTLTAHWLSGGAPVRLGSRPAVTWAVFAGAFGLLLVGVSGAIAALGDTLYPATSLSDAWAAELSATSHALIRLRLLHPALAILVALVIAATIHRLPVATTDRRGAAATRGRTAVRLVAVAALLQLGVGFINVLLLAPVWVQLVHLLVADVLWIAYVIAGASALATEPAPATTPAVASAAVAR